MTKPDLNHLVRLARRERPPAAALDAIARQLGLPFVAAPVSAAVLSGSAGVETVLVKLGLSRPALVGWSAGSALAVTGGALALTLGTSHPPPMNAPTALAPVAVKAPAAVPPPAVQTTPETEARSLPSSPERQRQRDAPSPWEEPQLIERARKALVTDPKRALSLTQEHQRRFPRGALGVEREVIALEALARTGQLAEARRLALVFEAKHPTSIHMPRVRSLLGRLGRP